MSADNQQERLNASWIVGFTDGEGCFHVSLNKNPKMTLNYQVLPEFRIVQNKKDEQLLEKIKDYFGFGSIRINRKDHHGTRMEFRVRGKDNIDKIINFFKKNPLQTSKKEDFRIFSEIVDLMKEEKHLTMEGLKEIRLLTYKMNRRKHLESSETIRLTQSNL
tara:strand:+ start:1828 stop:2313 length:486 start_codon:yes stop_codon:yes gene_type:complete